MSRENKKRKKGSRELETIRIKVFIISNIIRGHRLRGGN